MLTIDIQTTLLLDEPSNHDGFVTWIEADVIDDDAAARHTVRVGHAQVAVVHVGMIADAGCSVAEVLDADSGELAVLHDTYFEDGWLRGDLTAGGSGSDLLYVSQLALDEAYAGTNLDVAIVQRLCETVGAGCGLAVLPYMSTDDVTRWIAAGFRITRPVRAGDIGYLHWTTALRPRAMAAGCTPADAARGPADRLRRAGGCDPAARYDSRSR